jgi:hypothetical protein
MMTLQEDMECDPLVVEGLVMSTMNSMSKEANKLKASPSEVLSAILTLLDRSLRGVRKFQDASDRFANAKEISRTLNDLLVDHGRVPH